MQTLSYGYKKPETGDTGATVFPAMADNIQRLNDHTHDGSNSAPIPASSGTALTSSILAANWVATSGGRYRQLITIPAAITTIEKVAIELRTSAGIKVYAAIEKASATTYYVYTLDNTVAYTAYYTS